MRRKPSELLPAPCQDSASIPHTTPRFTTRSTLHLLRRQAMRAKSGFLIAVALVAVGGNVHAALVQFEFGGSASSVPDPYNDFGGSVSVGDSFVGSFAYDLATPDIQPLAELGYYLQSPVTTGSFSASVGPLAFQLKPGTEFGVTVINGSTDELFISGTLLDSTGHQWHTEWKLGYHPAQAVRFPMIHSRHLSTWLTLTSSCRSVCRRNLLLSRGSSLMPSGATSRR